MKTLFYKEYFEKAPIIGQGYHYDPNLAKTATDIYLAIVQRQAEAGDEFSDVRNFIEMRQPHEGVLHALLVSGALGIFFFSVLCLGVIFYAWRSVVHTPPNDITPIQTWSFALLLTQVVGFFLLFGDYTGFLIQVCPITALLVRAETLRQAALKTRPPLFPNPTTYHLATFSAQS
jgi:hypothetical protein